MRLLGCEGHHRQFRQMTREHKVWKEPELGT